MRSPPQYPNWVSHDIIKERIAEEKSWHCVPSLHVKAGARVKERIFQIHNVNAYDSRLTVWMQRFNRVATNPKSWLVEAVGPTPGDIPHYMQADFKAAVPVPP